MAWVNLFDNEACRIGYAKAYGDGNDPFDFNFNYPNRYVPESAPGLPVEGTTYPIERGRQGDFQIPAGTDEAGVSAASFIREGGVAKLYTYGESEYVFPANLILVMPEGGLVDRRFRLRVEGYSQRTTYCGGFLSSATPFDGPEGDRGIVAGITSARPDDAAIWCGVDFIAEADTIFSTSYEEIPYFSSVESGYEYEPTLSECPFLCVYMNDNVLDNLGAWEAKFEIEVWVDNPTPPEPGCNFNCECEDEYPTRTLAQMREFLMIRLGWAAMKDTPLPGVNDTLNAFLQDAQEQLHAEYRLPRLERFFTWDLVEGVRFYDLIENVDVCTKELDPRQLTWVGISDGCDAWRPLVCGIAPESYYSDVTGIPSRYEIRQCIEVWPAPSGEPRKLRIKGYFYNEALTADDDVASLDYQAVQLYALANAKAHYGQQDAANVMRQAMRYIANMTAGAHHTRRYVPGTTEWVAPPLPVLTGYPGDP